MSADKPTPGDLLRDQFNARDPRVNERSGPSPGDLTRDQVSARNPRPVIERIGPSPGDLVRDQIIARPLPPSPSQSTPNKSIDTTRLQAIARRLRNYNALRQQQSYALTLDDLDAEIEKLAR